MHMGAVFSAIGYEAILQGHPRAPQGTVFSRRLWVGT